jgi:N-acetylglucosamine malate deacetylase 1
MKLAQRKSIPTVLAVGAHPDDIEFRMAGTLLLLRRAGWDVHYLNVANGSCGSRQIGTAKLIAQRRAEAQAAARVLGAQWHPSYVNDLEVFYELDTIRRLVAVMREIQPSIILTHPPIDYMEDHTNTCRLTVTAAFILGAPNFRSLPARRAIDTEVTIYHCIPHGLCDGLRRPLLPEAFVNTTAVHATKLEALAKHQSQQAWLDATQGFTSYLQAMEDISLEVGRRSGKFTHAEGWNRHLHYGYSAAEIDPLRDILGADFLVNRTFAASLRATG